jgi:FKBP-type peptidyl-prolyl cis-trans isomerase
MKATAMFKKIVPAVAASAIVLGSLVACSSSASADCTPTKSGTDSAKVTVSGKVGASPKVKLPSTFTAKTTQRTELTAGKGTPAVKGSTISINYALYDGTTGKKLGDTETKAGTDVALTSDTLVGIYKTLHCTAAGSRVVGVIPPVDAFGATGNSDLGIGAKDTIVMVADVIKVSKTPKATPTPTPTPVGTTLKKANGAPKSLPAGYPKVTLAASGAPTIAIPKAKAPTKLEIADSKVGTGATVQAGDTVTVEYTGVIWRDNSVFDSSWTRGAAATFPTTGVIPGFSKALVGQKVGSQVVAIIPPVDGYGSAGQAPILGTDTIVFVVDILSTAR